MTGSPWCFGTRRRGWVGFLGRFWVRKCPRQDPSSGRATVKTVAAQAVAECFLEDFSRCDFQSRLFEFRRN